MQFALSFMQIAMVRSHLGAPGNAIAASLLGMRLELNKTR